MMLSSDSYLKRVEKKNWVDRWLLKKYVASLGWTMARARYVVGALVALLLLSVVLFMNMGRSFLPEFNEKALTIAAVSRPGISLEESHRIGAAIEKELMAIPEVVSTARRTGRGELDEHSQTVNGAEIDVNFALGKRSKEELQHKSFATPGALHKAGVKVCIVSDANVIPIEFLPLYAGLAASEGLPLEAAWKAITINPAQVMGIADRVGSLEPGKDGDVVIWTADPMTVLAAESACTIVDGKIVYQA
jgi:hypothetical protein